MQTKYNVHSNSINPPKHPQTQSCHGSASVLQTVQTSKTQTAELSSQRKLPASLCSLLNAAYTCRHDPARPTGVCSPGTPASHRLY